MDSKEISRIEKLEKQVVELEIKKELCEKLFQKLSLLEMRIKLLEKHSGIDIYNPIELKNPKDPE